MSSPELKIYTIRNLKEWIEDGRSIEGLTEAVITPTRAYSFIHNPYVTDDMPVASAMFVENNPAAFTAAFPEHLAKPNCITHWINSLYVSPKYEGKGYALFVLGSLLECYNDDPIFDLDAMDTSVEILKYLGLKTKTFPLYLFREKVISGRSVASRLLSQYNKLSQNKQHSNAMAKLRKEGSKMKYTLQYDNFIDYEAYDFMVTHSDKDAFLRQRESFNWMLHYSFTHEAPLLGKVHSKNLFSSSKQQQRYYVVKLYVEESLKAIYILCETADRLSLKYLYYSTEYEKETMQSIIEHVSILKKKEFTTTNKTVAVWMNHYGWYPMQSMSHPSFCYSNEYNCIADLDIQGGDGDMFLN